MLKDKISEMTQLPKDVVLGVPILTVVGQSELNIENYRGIIEYTDTLVRIQTKEGQIRVIGKSLHVDYYSNEEMKISGHFQIIEYME